MGWEVRKGRRYLYRVRKVNGRVVREYVGRDSQAGRFMGMMLFHMQDLAEEAREKARRQSAELRSRVAGVLGSAAEVNAELRVAAEAVLVTVGFHNHHRGSWRMAKKKPTATRPGQDLGDRTPRAPSTAGAGGSSADASGLPAGIGDAMIVYTAPDDIPGAADLFARARAGDKAAQAELRRWLRETPGQLDWYGDMAMRSTMVMVGKITGGDPFWRIAVEEKLNAMRRELLGENPTVLDQLLVRRVVNGWLAVHALELEMAARPPSRMSDRAYLETAIGKASKRYTQAVSELARVRRLQLPQVLVNVTSPPPPLPRRAEAEAVETAGRDEAGRLPAGGAKKGKGGKGPTRMEGARSTSRK